MFVTYHSKVLQYVVTFVNIRRDTLGTAACSVIDLADICSNTREYACLMCVCVCVCVCVGGWVGVVVLSQYSSLLTEMVILCHSQLTSK